jgi:hypothetical protein
MLEANVLDELMAKPKITITVSEEVYQSKRADKKRVANLAACTVSRAIKDRQKQKNSPTAKTEES